MAPTQVPEGRKHRKYIPFTMPSFVKASERKPQMERYKMNAAGPISLCPPCPARGLPKCKAGQGATRAGSGYGLGALFSPDGLLRNTIINLFGIGNSYHVKYICADQNGNHDEHDHDNHPDHPAQGERTRPRQPWLVGHVALLQLRQLVQPRSGPLRYPPGAE